MPDYSQKTLEAVITLLQDGQTPSWRKVREITGTGSSNDILRETRAILSDLASRGQAGEYPSEAQEAFWIFWNSVKKTALGEFSQEKAQLSESLAQMEATATQAVESQQAAIAEIHKREEDIAGLQENINQALAREQGLNDQLTASAARLDAERERCDSLVAELKTLNLKIQSNSEAAQAALAAEISKRNEIVAQMAKEMHDATARFTLEMKNETERYNKDTGLLMRKWDAERTQHRQDTKELQQELKATQESFKTAQSKVFTLEKEILSAQALATRLQEKLDTNEQATGKLSTELGEERQALDALKAENAGLNERLSALETAAAKKPKSS